MNSFYAANLLFRPYTIEDVSLLATLYDDWKMEGDIFLFAKNKIEQEIFPQYEKYNAGLFAVFFKEKEEYVGHCGVKYDEKNQEWQLGFRFMKSFWHHDFPVEALRACFEYAFHRLQAHEIVVDLEKRNKGAAKMLEKAGMRYRLTIEENSETLDRYSIFC